MKVVPHSVTMISCTPHPEKLIERAGRVCYKSESGITEDSHVAFIQMLLDPSRKHESVIEHASATFHIVTDRGVTHEIVRHRLASYSQESTRYCNYGKDKFGGITVVRPTTLAAGSATDIWTGDMQHAEDAYLALLGDGVPPQVARSVLPTCLKTEIVMTANFREWRHFLKLRTSPAAHPDMRVVAELIRQQLVELAPNVFADFAN